MGGDCLKLLFSQLNETSKASLLADTGHTNVLDLISRVPKDVHFQISHEIAEKCKGEHLDVFLTGEFEDKIDHGDIDIYYVGSDVDIKEIIKKLFDPVVVKTNGNVTTFSFKFSPSQYFQIDFIKTNNPELARFFFSYGDIGMTLGMIAHHAKLKYGDNGLYLKLDGNQMNQLVETDVFNPQEEHILELTRDPLTISQFFGVSFDRWLMGFENMEEAYMWLARTKFYNPRHFVQNEGKLKRHEKPKRKFMDGFEEYSNRLLEVYAEREHIDIIEYTFNFFGQTIKEKFLDEIRSIAQKRKMDLDRASKFSGKKFVNKGILGKEVGSAIEKFKSYIVTKYAFEFNEWLDSNDVKSVNDEFEIFYSNYYFEVV